MDKECADTRKRANTTLFNRAVRGDTSPLVKLVAIVGDKTSDAMLGFLSVPNSNPHVLYEGNREDVLQKWCRALTAAKDINRADLPFTGYSYLQPGQSCNTVTATLMAAMGLNKSFHSPHVRIGFGRVLNDVVKTGPANAEQTIDALRRDAMAGLSEYMAEANERFAKKRILQEKLGILL